MKQKDKPVSKISTTQTNTNQKNYNKDSESMNSNSSLLKKNEFTLIIAGALVATVIVFFVFFKSSGPGSNEVPGVSSTGGGSLMELEKRIGTIEAVLEKISTQGPRGGDAAPGTPAELPHLQQQVQRLETSVSVKFDSLIERMGKMEKQVRVLRLKPSVPAVKTKAVTKKSAQKTVSQKTIKKSTVATEKKAAMFHTVQKGETLWSISQKYKTSVANLRKLNKMSSTATIYPGTNLLIR
jgi:LysM repeat protein